VNTALNSAVTPLLALVLVGCAHAPVRAEPCPACHETVARTCPDPMVAEPLPRLRAPPTPPVLTEVPPGCPSQFLRCLTPEAESALQRYIREVRAFAVDVYRRGCVDGR
jgi:hypothetical protein